MVTFWKRYWNTDNGLFEIKCSPYFREELSEGPETLNLKEIQMFTSKQMFKQQILTH